MIRRLFLLACLIALPLAAEAQSALTLEPCRLKGIAREVQCGRIEAPAAARYDDAHQRCANCSSVVSPRGGRRCRYHGRLL